MGRLWLILPLNPAKKLAQGPGRFLIFRRAEGGMRSLTDYKSMAIFVKIAESTNGNAPHKNTLVE